MPDDTISATRSRLVALRAFAARCAPCRYYLAALAIFAASRAVVVAAVQTGEKLVRPTDFGLWDVGPAWYHRLARWDSGWYARIADDGYQYSSAPHAANSINFFPLYPLVSAGVKAALGVDTYIALLLVANVSAVAAILLLAKFARDEIGDEAGLLTVAFFCFCPATLFMSAAYSESLCLVFVLLSLILMTRARFAGSALMSGLATAARPLSIALAPAILWEMWRTGDAPLVRRLPRMAIYAVIAVSGLLAYMTYLWIAFGQPLGFVESQDVWHDQKLSDRVIAALTLRPFIGVGWREATTIVAFLALTLWSWRYLRFALVLQGLGAVLIPYLLDGISGSTGRYLLPCFPAFMALALICRGRPWMVIVLTGFSAGMLFRKAALFSQWYWEG